MKAMFSLQDGEKVGVTLLTDESALRKGAMPKASLRLAVTIGYNVYFEACVGEQQPGKCFRDNQTSIEGWLCHLPALRRGQGRGGQRRLI